MEPELNPETEQKSAELPARKPADKKQNFTLYIHDLVYMLAAVMLVLMVFFRIIIVDGPSMQNTLQNGDYMLLVSNLFCGEFEAGDVVVISQHTYEDGKPIVKRIIATEGQTVDIDFENGIVYVDGVALDEPYISTQTKLREGAEFPQTVEEGCVFVLGDNRMNSRDSRYPGIGQIDTRELLGKVVFLMFPGTGYSSAGRDFSRIGVVS